MTMRIERAAAIDQDDVTDHRNAGSAEQQFRPAVHRDLNAKPLDLRLLNRASGSDCKNKTARLLSQTDGFGPQIFWRITL